MLLAVVIGLILQSPYVALILLAALVFDFINGFHDAANSIATIVSTRVLSPVTAVAWAAFFNFVAAAPVFFGGELRVAQTMGQGIIQLDLLKAQGVEIVLAVIFAALMGAIVWNLLTWWWGLPSSSSHALAGGMVGATLPALGVKELVVSGILKIAAFIVLSPLIGMALGSGLMIVTAKPECRLSLSRPMCRVLLPSLSAWTMKKRSGSSSLSRRPSSSFFLSLSW